MSLRSLDGVTVMLDDRHATRMSELEDEWRDEAAMRARTGNPRQADYLEQLADTITSYVQALRTSLTRVPLSPWHDYMTPPIRASHNH